MMSGGTPEKPDSQIPREARRSWWEHPAFDVVAKVGVPVVLAIFTGLVGWTANRVQSEMSAATLLSEREKSESELRASMFKSLIDPFVGGQTGGSLSPDREQLLVELLALNSHEHFEMKPLFQRVDGLLAAATDEGSRQKREVLRSIARRIIDRQIAMFQKDEDENESNGRKAHVYSLTIVEEPTEEPGKQREDQQRFLEKLKRVEPRVYQVREPIDNLISSDQTHRFTMIVSQATWDKQELTAEVYESSAKSSRSSAEHTPTTVYPIRLTWFDFPLTDNTLFPDGNRFSVVLYNVVKRDSSTNPLANATLKFIVFPKNYYTPRERPFNEGKFLQLVGKK